MILAILAAAQVVGVLEFRDKVPAEQRIDAAYLSDQVRSAVKETLPQAKVITRENMLVLLQSTGRKLEECQGECEVDTGRRIGADLVVSGELLRFGTQYKLNMKLHDTRSGELLAGTVASGATADDLDRALRPAVEKLLASLRPEAFQDRLSDQRQAAKEPAPFVRPAYSAHLVGGFGSVTGNGNLVSLTLGESQGSASALSFGAGVDAGIHLGPSFSVSAFAEYARVATVTEVNLLVFGVLGRVQITRAASVAAAIGFSRFATNVTGPAALGAFDYLVYEALALRAQVLYAHEANSTGLFDGPDRALCLSAGLSLLY